MTCHGACANCSLNKACEFQPCTFTPVYTYYTYCHHKLVLWIPWHFNSCIVVHEGKYGHGCATHVLRVFVTKRNRAMPNRSCAATYGMLGVVEVRLRTNNGRKEEGVGGVKEMAEVVWRGEDRSAGVGELLANENTKESKVVNGQNVHESLHQQTLWNCQALKI